MSKQESQLKMTKTWKDGFSSRLLFVTCLIALGIGGCIPEPEIKQGMNQEQLGLGIVIGTRGYQQIQKDLAPPGAFSLVVEGQVIKIEGAAYVVREVTQQERRIPVDQNTTIDHPAHVGDWIAAYFDSHGRAIHIRNIDEEIIAREVSVGQE